MPRSRLAGTHPSAYGRSRLRKEGVKHGRAASLLLVPPSFAPQPPPSPRSHPSRSDTPEEKSETPERVPPMLQGIFFILFDFIFYYSCSKEEKGLRHGPKSPARPLHFFPRGLLAM